MRTLLPLFLVIFLGCVFWFKTCTNEKVTLKILQQSGYRTIHLQGYKWFACSHDDWSHTGFTAINYSGNHIKGVVCCGLIFKNCTIRLR